MRTGSFATTRRVVIPKGWKMSVFARVADPRLMLWTPDHRLLISRPEHGDVVKLVPRGVKAPLTRILIKGLRQPHGLAYRKGTLYVAESNQINAYRYRNGLVSNRRIVVRNLPDAKSPDLGGQYAHALKSVVAGPSGLFYSIGSIGNTSSNDRRSSPQRATVYKFADGRARVYARGVRNGTGLAFAPNGGLWTAVNSRDNMPYPHNRDWNGDGSNDYGKVIQSYVDNHPIEPVARLTPGRDLGWPYCFADADVTPSKGSRSALAYAKRPFVADAETNRGGRTMKCGNLKRIEQGLPAHSAPLGMSFATVSRYGTGALIGVHGSWNRATPREPCVVFMHWANGTLGGRQVLVKGFQNADGSRWGRPVSAVKSPASSSIYISDDYAGAIYRLTPG
ncbi:gluconolaconase [Jatrophihabitans fulvus]